MSFDCSRYQVPFSNWIAGYDDCPVPSMIAVARLPPRPRAHDELVLDALFVERLLDLPAGMPAELCPEVLAAVELHGHASLLRGRGVYYRAVATIGIGMLGYAFMGKAHSNAFKKIAYMTWPPPLEPKLVGIAGRNAEAVEEAARRYGFEYATDDWRRLVEDDAIGLFDNGGPNSLHAEPTIAAARAGKHVVCEKPLGRDAAESYDIWQAVDATGVKHMCAFNYRFVPAMRLAREMVDAGELGEVRHFRSRYLQDWGDDASLDTWRFDPTQPARARSAT